MRNQAYKCDSGGLRAVALRLATAVFAVLLLTQSQLALAATASELFADGNRLFRDDLYWAALLRYTQAAEAGMNTPLLDYNTGVAHYKAKQYKRARGSLLKASRFGPLQAVSHYNLGLNAYRMGNNSEAIRWLRSARDQQERKDISRLARRALAEIGRQNTVAVTTAGEVSSRQAERALTNLDLRFRAGAGFDDNVFRSPAQSYVDLSDPAQPVVDPLVQSGLYIPVSLSAKYQVNAYKNEGFFGAYRFGGRFYQDKALTNADEFLHEFSFGSEYRRRTEDRERRVYSAFKVAQHDETYYDPDTGVERTSNGVAVGDRMSYLRYGPDFWIRETFGSLSVGARAKGQLWNYETTTIVPEYDHEYWLLGINTQYRFSRTALLRFTAEYYTRRYGDRPAYELDGTQPLGNPSVRYDYLEFGLTARQRITNAMWFDFSYRRTDREDRHVGYNSYSRDEFSIEYHLSIGQRFDFEAFAGFRLYDFRNAFAFNEPIAGTRTLETFEAGAEATFRMTDSLELAGEYFLRDVTSSDTRIEYNRGQFLLAVRWHY